MNAIAPKSGGRESLSQQTQTHGSSDQGKTCSDRDALVRSRPKATTVPGGVPREPPAHDR